MRRLLVLFVLLSLLVAGTGQAAFVVADRVQETTTSVGLGTVNLLGPTTGYRTFVAGVGSGNTTYYAIALGAEWEVGLGTVIGGSPVQLSRDTVLASSNAGAKVNFSAGTKSVFVTMPSSRYPVAGSANTCSSVNADASHFLRGDCTWQTIGGGGDALVASPLSQFAATSSVQLRSVLSDETGAGLAVFNNAPTFIAPVLGAASGTSLTLSTPLGVASGGIGVGTLAIHGVVIGQGTSPVSVIVPGAAGQVLTSNGASSDPTFQASAGGSSNFGTITSATNTTAAMVVGTGASLATSGTGTITASGGTSTFTIGVGPFTGQAQLGTVLITNATAPATPAAGTTILYVDPTNKVLMVKEDGGQVTHTVATNDGAANMFLTSISDGGAVSAAQPTFANLSGIATPAQLSATVNAQTGTTYTVLNGDRGKLVTTTNGSAIAVTLPQAGAGSAFLSGWFVDVQNRGVGTATITPTTSTIDGAASLALTTGQGVRLFSDGTTYFSQRGIGAGGSGTVTSIATTSPITGGTITTTGTIACATCVTSAAALTSGQLVAGAGSQASAVTNLTGDVTTSGAVATTIAANAVTSAKMAVVNTRRVCSMVVGAENGAALADADIGPQYGQCKIPFAATVVEIDVVADAGVPSVIPARRRCTTFTANVCSAYTNANFVSAALAAATGGFEACSKTSAVAGLDTGTTCSATLQNTTLVAGDWIVLVSGTAGGTAKRLSVDVIYTVD